MMVAAGLGLVCFAPSARAGEPNTMAKNQIFYAFGHCDGKIPAQYFGARDRALAADPSIRTYAGQIQGQGVTKDKIVQCDREMTALVEQEKKADAISAKSAEVDEACRTIKTTTDPGLTRLQSLRTALAAESAGFKGKYKGKEPAEVLANCDRHLGELKTAEAKRRDEDAKQRQEEAKRKAEDAARNEEKKRAEAAAEAKRKALVGALKGDRASVFKKYGAPQNGKTLAEALRASRWEYVFDVEMRTMHDSDGVAVGDSTAPCTHRFDFNGDKIAKSAKVGPGCPYQ